ncbi:MAG TPA: penicillin-binding protein activator LpoB [Victivallales bacterium]|nr:penicillin-binding protein activator LpoB [Victivallales bacterium]
MKFFLINVIIALAVSAILAGCGTNPHRIDPNGNAGITTAHDINFKDWQNVADKAAESLIRSGVLKRTDNRKNVIMVSNVKNKTTQHINTAILTSKLRRDILKSGQALTTTAVSSNGPEDVATRDVRMLEHDDLFDKKTVKKQGTAVAPDMSLSGTIIQQKTKLNRKEESYFFFHVVLTDLHTGLAVWEDSVEVAKQKKKALIGY